MATKKDGTSRAETRMVKSLADEERDLKIAKMYLRNMSQYEIGKALGLTQGRVSQIMKELREKWYVATMEDFGVKVGKELARIDHLEQVAWEAWERSCLPEVTTRQATESGLRRSEEDSDTPPSSQKNKVGKGKKKTKAELVPVKVVDDKRQVTQVGNRDFLTQVSWCIEQRCKLNGLYTDINVTQNNISIGLDWSAVAGELRVKSASDPVEERIKRVGLEAIQGKPTEQKNGENPTE